ncbi:Hemocyanin E chain, partial [Orchesella cincta]
YNAERLSNGFARTVELGLYPGAPIVEGYDAHIKDFNSGQWWTPRAPETPLTDILHIHDPDFARDIIITDVLGLYNKFVKAIKWGKLITAEGKFLPIRFHEGLQPLANTVEASNLSVNPFYYDAFGLHNLGHLMVALAADPDFTKGLPTGIMAEAAVRMRDPSFYTYHAIIDNLFEKFKQTLVPYKPHGGVWPLEWHGVDIVDVKLVSHGSESHNQLTTFYIKHKYQLEPGVDRSVAKGIEKAEICAVHLDHAAFQFQIMIDRKTCAKSKSGQGTVRIFMAPRYNEHGDRLPLAEQRRLMFILDTFQADLKVGRNIITRNSRDNSLTKPWSRSLKDYERGPDPSGAADYCGCGFPTHLFIPKGNTKGMAFDLFVMVTNFDEDYVPNHPIDMEIPETCNSPYIFCGHPRRRYPDARPMGYPWDRPPTHVPLKKCGKGLTLKDLLCKITGKFVARPAATLEEYVSIASNMAMTVFEIKHIPKVVGKHYG